MRLSLIQKCMGNVDVITPSAQGINHSFRAREANRFAILEVTPAHAEKRLAPYDHIANRLAISLLLA